MNCMFCGERTKVTDSRMFMGTVFRRRKCTKCNQNFWTSEDLADQDDLKELMHTLYKRRVIK